MRIYFFCFFILTCSALFSQAIKSPSEFLPHQIGDQFTPHHLLVDYFQYVADQSPMVELEVYGRTYEQRPLLLTFVSTPKNLAKVEDIRMGNLTRAGIESSNALEDISIVWLSFSVHGNEAAGSESAMPILHQLITSDKGKGWLENTLVIMDPCINPDGYSRYSHWNRSVANRRLTIDANSIEHNEPWPGGRTNHYYFDLNRDWAWQTQKESQQRMKKYLDWLPHIHVDFHEMGYTSPYYFAPAAQPYHEYLTDWQRSFQKTIGENHSKYFDKNGWLFYTREVFDLLYPSYGDTYPMFHGGIGMTYEQGGSGRASRGILLPTGDTLTLHDRVAHHVTTALSTIEMGSKHSSELIANFSTFYDNSSNKTPGKFQAYVLKSDHTLKLKSFKELLDNNRIKYSYATDARKLSGTKLNTGESSSFQLSKGDLIVNLNQPHGLFAQVLLEPEPKVVDSLTYDITAWSVALGFGLDAYGLDQNIDNVEEKISAVSNPKLHADAYAYVIPWGNKSSSRLVAQLMDLNISLRVATESFRIENESYPRSSIIILRGDNRRNEGKLLEALEEMSGIVPVNSIQSSWMQSGPDFGSGKMKRLTRVNALSLIGPGTSSLAAGQVWHYFEQRLNYPVTLVEKDEISKLDLTVYNVIILPEGFYTFNDREQSVINDWVRQGGKLIAMGSAIRSLNGWEGYSLTTGVEEDEEDDDEEEEADTPYNQRNRNAIKDQLPGALIQTKLDITHPLAYGLTNPYFSLKTGSRMYQPLETGWNVGKVGESPLTYGFIGSNLKSKLSNSLVFGIKSQGRGSVVYLVDNPLFRGFWEEGNLLMDNALFLAGN